MQLARRQKKHNIRQAKLAARLLRRRDRLETWRLIQLVEGAKDKVGGAAEDGSKKLRL